MDLKLFYENFLHQVGSFLPGVLGALFVLIVGWLIASGLSRLIANLVNRTGLQTHLNKKGSSKLNLYKIVKKFVFYILMAIVLLVVLEMLGVENVLQPLEDMLSQFLTALPRIVGAIIISFVGYVIATAASDIVGIASGAIERFYDRFAFAGAEFDATKLVKQLVFLIIFIPLLITAFDYLNMNVISDPAKMMLAEFLHAIPNIIAAALIIAVFYFVGRYVTQLLSSLLHNMSADDLPAKLGISKVFGNRSFSTLIGNVAFFFLMFFGVITAAEKLNFGELSDVLRNMLDLTGNIFFGLIILAVGNFIANIAHKALAGSDSFLASIARVAILGLFLAISLRSMGIADEIINLAFGLILGAIAVAIALSFGLGGREAAGKQMEIILKKFRKES